MLKSYKTEITPTHEQIQKINKTIGTCRFIYNFYISHNKELYSKGEKFMTAKSFSVWLNNEFVPNNPEFLWIKEVSSKSVKKSMGNAYTAFNRFFKKQSGFPRFKKKNKSDVKMYFVKNNPKDCFCERYRINIPTLGWVKLKEKGYIPTTKDGYVIKNGTVIDFQNLCTCVKEFTEDMIGFYADSHGTSLLLQIIPKVQIRRIINHYTGSSLEKIKKLWEEYGEE